MRSQSSPVSPYPTPATSRRHSTDKAARKAAARAAAHRDHHKATSKHDGETTHKSSRRKGVSNDPIKSADPAKNSKDGSLDFAALLAQTAAAPALPPAQVSAAADQAKAGDAPGADAATALLRPVGLTTTDIAADDAATAEVTGDLAESAAGAAASPATDAESAAAAPAESPISIPAELAAAANKQAANATSGDAARLQQADARDATQVGDLPAAGQNLTGITSGTGSTAPDATQTTGEQTTGQQASGDASAGQPQPDLAGAAAAGLQPSAGGSAGKVSDTPMPAHAVAPTIAQVAQSLRSSGDGTSRLVIRLDPAELGPVLVSLRTRGGAVDISVRADNAGGAAAVADQRAHIQQVLADHGLDLSSFNVSGGDASGGPGSATTDTGTSDSSGDGAPNDNSGADPSGTSYADVQAQASGADSQAGERRSFAAPQDGVRGVRTTVPTPNSPGAAAESAARVRTVRREGTWL